MSAICRRSWPNMLAITTIGGRIDRWDNGRPAHREQVRLIEALKFERSSRYLCSEAFITFISKPHDDDGSNSCALQVMTGVVHRWHAVFNEAEDLRAALTQTRVNKRAVEALFEAVERRDSDGVRAGYDENITIHEAASLPYGGDYRGLDGALRHGQGFRAAWDRFQPYEARGLDPRIIADGDHVVVLWRHKVENPDSGDRLDLPAVSIYRMENEKVADSRMFHFDAAALLRFLERNAKRPVSQASRGVL